MTNEELLQFFEPVEIKPTYCSKIMSACLKALKGIYKTQDLHYTYDGIKSIVLDPNDGQKYEITIKPIK